MLPIAVRNSRAAAFVTVLVLVVVALSATAQAAPTRTWQVTLPPPGTVFAVASIVRDDCLERHHARVNRVWLERQRVGHRAWKRFAIAGQTDAVSSSRDASVTVSTRTLSTPTRALEVMVNGPGPRLVQRYHLRASSETIVSCGSVVTRLPPQTTRITAFDLVYSG